jgi:vitamin B12 transporter
VRGPRSSLYGSDAIGGVIHIFTNQFSTQQQADIEMGYGSYNTRTLVAGVSGGNDRTQLRLNLSQLKSDGTNLSETNNLDNDGYEVERLSASIRQQLSASSMVNLSLYQSQGQTEYDGYTVSTDYIKESTQQAVSTLLTFAARPDWDIKLQASISKDESDNYEDGVLTDIFHTQRQQYSWQNNLVISDATLLTLGLDKTAEQIASQATTYTETARDVLGSFAEIQTSHSGHDILISLRRDQYNAIGNHTTGNLDWGYALSKRVRLTAGYGTAFKAPTFNDLYYPNMPWGVGNAALQPESSNSVELGLQGKSDVALWAINAYRTKIDDLIEWQCTTNCATPSPWDDIYQPFNVSSVQIDGIEGSIEHQTNARGMKVSLTLLNPRDLTSGNRLLQRASTTLRIDLNKRIGNWRNGVTILSQGSRYADSANTRELGGYTTVDLSSHYALNGSWALKGKINNLFNKAYLTTDTTFQPSERTFMLSISYHGDRG